MEANRFCEEYGLKSKNAPYRFTVHMLAFAREYCTRTVGVPKGEVDASLNATANRKDGEQRVCDLVYYYGQNDFQPQPCPSVSKGDIIELWDRRLFIVCSVGFKEIDVEQLIRYINVPQRDRHFQKLINNL